MLEIFRALFSSGDSQPSLINEATTQFLEMLDLAHQLLEKVIPHLMEKDLSSSLKDEVRTIDKSTNKLERGVRKLLVEHLSFDNQEASTCLILMSVVKDAERLVDECRDLLDLTDLVADPLPENYKQAIIDNTIAVKDILKTTRDAFANNDEKLALDIVENEKPFFATLKPIQDALLDDNSINARQAIIATRSLRLINRIRAHLANIASTVIFPIHQIDFAKRKYVDAAKQRIEGK